MRSLRAQELDRDEVLESTGWTLDYVTRVEKQLLASEAESDALMTTPERFADFKMKQREVVRQLDGLVATTRNDMAKVGALRLKSEIYDKVLQTGQKMGVIEEKVKELRVIGGITVSTMTREQLEEMLLGRRKDMLALAAPTLRSPIAGDVIDADFEELDEDA